MEIKSREYYLEQYERYWNQCRERATDEAEREELIQNEIPDSEVLAGYYLDTHGKHALRAWIDNITGMKKSSMDRDAETILKELCKE